jgi:SAM-dependent methyltransferase
MTRPSAEERQSTHREIWAAKPVLREVYGDLYRRIAEQCVPGLTVEVGGGSGNFKDYAPDVVSFDIVHEPWLDFVADAQALPLKPGSIANIVMLDVLHHIQYPVRFLREAAGVLRRGGRLICVEPGISALSGVLYRTLHEEPVDMLVDPLADGVLDPNKDPYVGNQAIPTLLATKYREQLSRVQPDLPLLDVRWLSLFAYPLSGGFKKWSLLTPGAARGLLGAERHMERWLGPLCAFRLMLVFGRSAS